MKRITSILAVTFAAACITISASAQDSSRRGQGGQGGGMRRSPEERAKMQTEQMTKQLSLDAATTAKVDSINLKFAKEQGGGMRGGGGQGAGGGMEDRMKAMKKVQDDKNAAFKTVLSEKQYADYIKMQDEQQKKMMERMQNGGGQQ